MTPPSSNQIRRSISRFRRLALAAAVCIALLTAAMILSITSVLDSTTATKINLVASQQMLTQLALTDALEIDTAARTGQWDRLDVFSAELTKTADGLRETHQQLSPRSPAKNLFTNQTNSEIEAYQSIELPINELLKSINELQKLTTSMIRRAPYVDQQTLDRVTAAKSDIEKNHARLGPGIEAILTLYEDEYKSKIATSISHAKVGLGIILAVLAANILFITEPTVLIIRKQVRAIEKATRSAKRSDAIRWRLLTNMGHEFRTPMNAIMGFADLLNEGSLSVPERARLSKSIYDSSTQLTHLISTMLDMSAIESGQLSVTKSKCNPAEILAELRINSSAAATIKGIELALNFDASCPDEITTDPKRFEQILYNLLDNAIKFTPSGTITINARLINEKTSPMLECTITDTGIGINPKDIEQIFDPFRQGEDTLTRNFGGAGLGLAVSRDLARAMGGDVTAKSTKGQGSTFTLTIDPGQFAQKLSAPEQSDEQTSLSVLQGHRILIVDDAKDNRVLLKHIFKRTGAEIEFAFDGQQAIEAINAAISDNTPYEVILMDMQMPVLDGYHATVELRKQGLSTPIIALTAHALDGDREHCLQAGCDEYLAKPVDKKKLFETCIRFIEESNGTKLAA